MVYAGQTENGRFGIWPVAQSRLGRERLDLQSFDSTEMLGIGGEECEVVLECGSTDQSIGKAHAMPMWVGIPSVNLIR